MPTLEHPTAPSSFPTSGTRGPTFAANLPFPPNFPGAGNYTLVFTFTNSLTSVGNASVTGHDPATGTGMVSNTAITPNASLNLAANQYQVNFTNVSNAQYITVTLNSVLDVTGASGDVLSPQMAVLLGNVKANRFVNAADIAPNIRAIKRPFAAQFSNQIVVAPPALALGGVRKRKPYEKKSRWTFRRLQNTRFVRFRCFFSWRAPAFVRPVARGIALGRAATAAGFAPERCRDGLDAEHPKRPLGCE